MKKPRKRGKPFAKGFDPRRRVGFTREECQRGYQATKRKFEANVEKYAWFWRKMRSFYRARGTWFPQSGGPNDEEPAADVGRGEHELPF